MEDKIEINDESMDRKYFTIIPNYILNHSTAVAQALYLQLKRLAGENGKAYPSSGYLRKQLGISQPTLRKEMGYLLQKGWIKYAGETPIMTDGGEQKVKTYKIIDLWDLNNQFFQRGEKIDTPRQRGEKIDRKGVKTRGEKIGNKEEPPKEDPSLKKNPIASKARVFSFEEEVKKLEDSPRRDLNVIALILSKRRADLRTKEQFNLAVTRYLRSAKQIKEFSDDQILKAVKYCEKEYPQIWVGETILKVLTK